MHGNVRPRERDDEFARPLHEAAHRQAELRELVRRRVRDNVVQQPGPRAEEVGQHLPAENLLETRRGARGHAVPDLPSRTRTRIAFVWIWLVWLVAGESCEQRDSSRSRAI